MSAIVTIEEYKITKEKAFTLRYVVLDGEIDTPINKEIAYGMMGNGLTNARNKLNELKQTGSRFYFKLKDLEIESALNNLFIGIQSIVDGWKIGKDYYVVAGFLKTDDYKRVAENLKKDRSLMWKRKKSLKIEEYNALKKVAFYLGSLYA